MSEVMSYQVGLDRLNQLREYYELEHNEISELCRLLDSLWGYEDYVLTKNFRNAVAEEILAQLDNYKQYATIVEEEETYVYPVKYLKWIDD